ncbi:MAG: aminotransferase class I/II-fold pyridoxal phosphate-dependent enzyme [Bacteroidetes bacterium]|nr:aminotransferase class I/II-fold pyridoxal phosphate-dependent enzyme [Bacteroidota bacterium]
MVLTRSDAAVNGRNISLNMNVRGLKPSATLAINEHSNALLREGKIIFKLGLGQSPFPVPECVVDALRHHAHEKDYLPVKGLPELREAIADFHRRKDHINASAEGVLIGPGSKELMFLLQLVYYGEILLPTPCWVSYGPQATIIGRNVKFIHTTFDQRWRITASALRQYLEGEQDTYRPRLLILNYPGNPDGNSYSMAELQELAETAREYEIILLSDEIYGQLTHKGSHFSVGRFYPEGTIISSGLSKWCGAGGWRLGTFSFPKSLYWLLDAMSVVASETFTSVSAPIQHAAVRAFRGGREIEDYLCHVRRILRILGERCVAILQEAGIRVHSPNGAFYLFIELEPLRSRLAQRGIHDSREMCTRLLLDTGVATLPGADFERPAQELSARLAYVNFDGAQVLSAGKEVPLDKGLPADFLDTHCANTLEAMRRIAGWVSEDSR